ncbi:MAG TPA: universal stress protein [Solirubrobacteraceae bacterium]|nr:universal stress protein [Solirubrobacteraceae bacterium]
MFRRVLVGVDGRPTGRDAIALARQLIARDGVITLAHMYGPELTIDDASSRTVFAERAEADGLLERERDAASLDAQLVAVPEHRVGRGLHVLAERLRADVLVVGSASHGLLGRVLMGESTRAGLSGAPCAVAIASRGYRHSPHVLEAVGVGYDDSAESQVALAAARELAVQHGAAVWALQVVSLGDEHDDGAIPADWPEGTSRLIRHTIERLRELGDDVEGDAICGRPQEELVRFGENLDLLVVGSRGYGPLGRLFHGGVSDYLARHAPCPLLILPRGSLAPGPGDRAVRSAEPVMTGARP